MNNKLDLLIRKNKGKSLLDDYRNIFLLAGIADADLIQIGLEESDETLKKVRTLFPYIEQESESLSSINGNKSKLLELAFSNASDNCYIYSDDVYVCGMFLTKSINAKAHCLSAARKGYSHTCFLLDENLKFHVVINFYNEENIDTELKNTLEVQLKMNTSVNL